jgi:Fe-S-cluster containining protein
MNTSPRIDPRLCRSCGECCKYFEIWYGDDYPSVALSEMQRFKALADIGKRISIHKVKGGYWLRFDFPCRHLVQGGDGRYSCAIYDSPNRPLLCQLFPHPGSTKRDCPHIDEGAV